MSACNYGSLRWAVIVASLFALLGCTSLEDYMFGQDNTLKPAKLADFTPTVRFVETWSVFTGGQSQQNGYLKLNPVRVGNVIYTASRDGVLQATDMEKGSRIWSVGLGRDLLSGPSVAQGYIAVTTRTSTLLLLSQRDGHIIWKKNLSSDALSKPVISGQHVFVKTINGRVYAFSLKTGEKEWGVDHGAPHLILKASASPVLFGKSILVGFSDGTLVAIDEDTGRLLWQHNIAYASGASDVERLVDIDADPIIRDGEVYLASYQGYVGVLSLKDGSFVWQTPASVYKNMAIDANTLYYVDSESVLWALNRSNGHVRWKQDALKGHDLTEPVLMGRTLLVGDAQGILHGLDVQRGRLISRTVLNKPIFAAPVVYQKRVYLLTSKGQLNCLLKKTV